MRDQKGLALAQVLFILVVAILVVGAIFLLARSSIETSKNNERGEQAFHLAEAGINWAQAQLLVDPGFRQTTTLTSFSTGTVSVVFQISTSTSVVVKATSLVPGGSSSYPDAQRALQVTFLIAQGSGGLSPSDYWKRPVTANSSITWSGSKADIQGPGLSGPAVLSNQSSGTSVAMNGNQITINGGLPDVGVVGSASARLVGNKVSGTSGQVAMDTIPAMSFAYWASQASGGAVVSQNYFNNNVTVTGPLTVNGDLTIGTNNTTIYGPIYVNGRITINADNVNINGIIYATGDINISSNNIREPQGSTRGLTFVSLGNVTESANNISINGAGGFAILAQLNVTISTNNFALSGLLYAGGGFSSSSNTFDLTGALSVRGAIQVSNNTFRITWKDFSSSPGQVPPGIGGSGGTTVTPTGWQEVPP